MSPDANRRHRVTTTVLACTIGTAIHLGALLNWTTQLDRTANPLGYASNFFDLQARAFLDGKLAVPDGALGIEAFRHNGQEYMYFGPFPALLRLPVLITTDQFDGRLTLVSMALAFAVFAIMTTRLLWLVRDLFRGDEPLERRESFVLGTILVLCLAGTSLTYNAALPWVYHEVYAWAVALAVGSAYWLVRVQRAPSRWSIGWLAGFALALVMTRTPGGFAVCLGMIAIGLWFASDRHRIGTKVSGLTILGLAVVCLGVGVGLNMAKFSHPYLFPLEDQVWTQLNAHRREALLVNGGTITGMQFFTTGLLGYFRPDGIRFVEYFPWITFPAEPVRGVGDAFIDQSYRMGSVTSFMPLLLIMALACLFPVFRPGASRRVAALRIPVVAMVLITGAVMNYGYYAYRYTGDFVPALVVGTLISGVYLAQKLQGLRREFAVPVLTVLVAGTAFSVVAHLLVAFQAAAFTSPGPVLTRYLSVQERITPGAQALLTTVSDSAPVERGEPDEIFIEGNCEALYLETGEDSDQWLLAERRSTVVVASLEPGFRASNSIVVTIGTDPKRWVRLQTNNDGEARVVLQQEDDSWPGGWFEVPPPYEVRIGIRDLPQWGYAEVASTPGGFVGYTRSFSWSEDWTRLPIPISVTLADSEQLAARGISLESEPGITPPTCQRILEDSLRRDE